METRKEKHPRDTSYALKSSVRATALESAGVNLHTHLILTHSKIFFDAFFWPRNERVQYERLYVRVGAVPSIEARDARHFVEEFVIPEMIAWVREIIRLPANSPRRLSEERFLREWPPRATTAANSSLK